MAELEQELADTQAALDEAETQNAALQEELASTQTDLADSQTQLESTQGQLSSTESELESTEEELASTEEELTSTEAELLDAQLQLARVGELVLANGTYVGQILGAKSSPYRVIVFDAAGSFRAAQVASDATITSGGSARTSSSSAASSRARIPTTRSWRTATTR